MDAQKLLLFPQRLERALELVTAVETGRPFGVQLSGPNGVGKSATALLAYLICVARSMPAVYISSAESWVSEARQAGGGDAFLLKAFWKQNADIIIKTPALRKVFMAALQDAPDAFAGRLEALRDATLVKAPVPAPLGTAAVAPASHGTTTRTCLPRRRLAVICDEVQHITRAVKAAQVESTPTEDRRSGAYFSTDWYSWTNANSKAFQRMSAASAHAERDTKLPDGEKRRRLRIMEPLHPDDRAALQAFRHSPAYVKDPTAREHVVHVAGNILRKLVMAAELLPRDGATTKADLRSMRQDLWEDMMKDCEAWFESVPMDKRADTARDVMNIIRGDVLWSDATKLYDAGIVYRLADFKRHEVHPVSAFASAVLLRVTSRHILRERKPLSSLSGVARGIELEAQVLAALDSVELLQGVPSKLLDGSIAPRIELRCGYSLPFTKLSEVVARDVPVLYRPNNPNYPCDAIRMPADDDPDGKVCLLECSVEDPLDADRVRKVRKWNEPQGVATQLAAQSGRKVSVALFYDDTLRTRERSNLSDDVKAMSFGAASPAASSPDAAADGTVTATAAGAASAATKSGDDPIANTVASSDLVATGSTSWAADSLGDVARVVDREHLTTTLGLLI